jgi:TonB family protein
MNIPEEFGNYLLLKKLREDALGETFRAGRVGREGIEQVVLLRVFNGQGIDGEKLWQRVSGRTAVQQGLRSPNIGTGVDLGKVRSFPYAAYDYVSGKNLATLFAQAARQRQPIPIDHALLISERLALALAAAYETRVQDERVLHGFVVPHLVMVSNEGETRLLGFEVAPGLRELWAGGWRHDDLRGYLAPEAAAGATAGKSDDVYSLGGILFELLASERLPGPPAGGYAPLIDALVLPNEGTPLPAGIAALLKKSLVPGDQRIPDALTWHKTISKLMIEGQYSSTTFNLAFFMHNLFRDEIDREHQEIEAEKKLELPRLQAVGAGAAGAAAAAGGVAAAHAGPAAAADMRERTGVRDAAWAAGAGAAGGAAHAGGVAAAGADRKPLLIGGAAAALLVLLAIGGYFLFGRSTGPAKPAASAAAASGDAARNAAALQAQIQQMIEARSKEMESKFKDQYNDQIKSLQQKLEDTKRAAAEQEKAKARGERKLEAATSAEASSASTAAERAAARAEKPERSETTAAATTAVGSSGASTGATRPSSPAAAGGSSASSAAAQRSSSPASSQPQGSTAASATGSAATGGGTPAAGAASTAAAAPSGAAQGAESAAAAARQPQLQAGDVVQAGPGVTMPKLLYKPEARYPAAARRMSKSAEVVVRLLVDERGKVEKVERVGAAAGLGFDEAALDAARRSSYEPASKDGVRVKAWTTIKITFKPMG